MSFNILTFLGFSHRAACIAWCQAMADGGATGELPVRDPAYYNRDQWSAVSTFPPSLLWHRQGRDRRLNVLVMTPCVGKRGTTNHGPVNTPDGDASRHRSAKKAPSRPRGFAAGSCDPCSRDFYTCFAPTSHRDVTHRQHHAGG